MSILVRTGLKMESSVMEMASMATEKVTTQPDKKKVGKQTYSPLGYSFKSAPRAAAVQLMHT